MVPVSPETFIVEGYGVPEPWSGIAIDDEFVNDVTEVAWLATVRTNESLAVRVPSLTLTVTVVVPVWFVTGVMVTVRLVPLPPNAMLALGTRVVLAEVPLTVRLDAGVSASLIEKGIAAVGVLGGVD